MGLEDGGLLCAVGGSPTVSNKAAAGPLDGSSLAASLRNQLMF